MVVIKTELPDLDLINRGKVRDIYDLGEHLLIVATDRISAFDVVLPCGIPDKGVVLTKLSEFWFSKISDIVSNHLITTDIAKMPPACQKYADVLNGRSMLVKKAEPLLVEFVARGYICGSGWKDYQNSGEICGIKLPKNMKNSQKFSKTIFTPATKAEVGLHDENIDFDKAAEIIGRDRCEYLKNLTIEIYDFAAKYAESKGIIIADTKMEFGVTDDGELILIDELLTPDSSRYWHKKSYKEGVSQDSLDKQIARDYLLTLDWDKTYPGPELPEEIITKIRDRYMGIMDIIMS